MIKIFNSNLNGFLETGFSEVIKKVSETIITTTIELFKRISTEKLPIP